MGGGGRTGDLTFEVLSFLIRIKYRIRDYRPYTGPCFVAEMLINNSFSYLFIFKGN